ncbi:non-muscle cofilin 1-like [Pholidichthys leucotaenia]
MASGVKVDDSLKTMINDMRLVKSGDDENERIRILTCEVTDTVHVKDVIREKELEGKDTFNVLCELMDNCHCMYILYDCHYETKDSGKKEELVFIMWSNDQKSCLKNKLLYASSKDAMKKCLSGVKHSLEINCCEDYKTRDAFIEKLGREAITLEGVTLKCHCTQVQQHI